MTVSNEVYRLFSRYQWRGNVRELRNVLTFALYDMGSGEQMLSINHLPARFLNNIGTETPSKGSKSPSETTNLAHASAEAERKALLTALAATKNNKTLAARLLGISRNKMYKKMHDLGLSIQ